MHWTILALMKSSTEKTEPGSYRPGTGTKYTRIAILHLQPQYPHKLPPSLLPFKTPIRQRRHLQEPSQDGRSEAGSFLSCASCFHQEGVKGNSIKNTFTKGNVDGFWMDEPRGYDLPLSTSSYPRSVMRGEGIGRWDRQDPVYRSSTTRNEHFVGCASTYSTWNTSLGSGGIDSALVQE
jgi:hypothetical protein